MVTTLPFKVGDWVITKDSTSLLSIRGYISEINPVMMEYYNEGNKKTYPYTVTGFLTVNQSVTAQVSFVYNHDELCHYNPPESFIAKMLLYTLEQE